MTSESEELKSLRNDVNSEPKNSQKIVKDQWGSEIEFLLSCITLSVGLGNVWRYVRKFRRFLLNFANSSQISIHSTREWWWHICYSLHHHRVSRGQTALLHGTFARTIFITWLHQGLWHVTSSSRGRCRPMPLHHCCTYRLCFSYGTYDSLLSGFLQWSVAVECLSRWMECYLHWQQLKKSKCLRLDGKIFSWTFLCVRRFFVI